MSAVKRLFLERGVEETPFLALRVADVAIHHLLVRRLEANLRPNAEASGAPISAALADQIGKARERLRKTIRELEDACARLGRPLDIGYADAVLPLVRQTADLLHRAELSAPDETQDYDK